MPLRELLFLAQSIAITSEFRRVDAAGEIAAPDRGGRPREMLSPAVARNAFASFRVAISVPAGKNYTLHLAGNPEGALPWTLYEEKCERAAPACIPDRLERIGLPVEGAGPARRSFWLDLWTPAETPVSRIRVEAQLHVDGFWQIAPLEVRVQRAVVPKIVATAAALPGVDAPADHSAHGPWKAAVCGIAESRATAGEPTVRSLIRRNALQDVALARDRGRLDAAKDTWCAQPPSGDPEWYLRVRDELLRAPAPD
ncbi:MAG: hypothetical protein ACRD96_12290 [Bryobacteraceae bacterium]